MGLPPATISARKRRMPVKVRDYYDWLAAQYDEATAAFGWRAPEHVWCAAAPRVTAGCRVLDLGVGTGQTCAPFLNRHCRCTGLDFSLPMLRQARRKYPDLDLVQADLDADDGWPLAPATFDLAISAGVYECLVRPKSFLARARRALRPGGRLVFTFDEFIPDHPAQGVRVGRADSGIPNPIEELASWLMHRYTINEVAEWCAEAGLSMVDHRRIQADVHFHFGVPVFYRLVIAERSAG